MPGNKSFFFVDYELERGQRDKELQSSQARSHAARESHRRKAYHSKRWEPVRVQTRQSFQRRQNGHEAEPPSVVQSRSYRGGGKRHNTSSLSLREVGEDMREPFGVLSFLNLPDYAHQVIEYRGSVKTPYWSAD